MMSWFSTNWPYVLTVWVVTHTIAQSIGAQYPVPGPQTWYSRVAHAWSALNPLDVMKAIAALSGNLSMSGGVPTVKP